MAKIYDNISQFITTQKVLRDSFYQKENAFVNKEEFAECFKSIGYSLGSDEINAIFTDFGLEEPTSKLELRLFYEKLTCWKDPLTNVKPGEIEALNMELINVKNVI